MRRMRTTACYAPACRIHAVVTPNPRAHDVADGVKVPDASMHTCNGTAEAVAHARFRTRQGSAYTTPPASVA